MDISKRSLLGAPLLASLALPVLARAEAAPAATCPAAEPAVHDMPVHEGPFQPTPESLKTYKAPEWFRDAKFGIWAHWGPQAVPRQGDWYARFMYVPGHPHYDHHLKTYGHPSEVGYKDIIPLWTAEKWDPAALMDKYAAAGARYFVSMACHHDNFDLWSSKHHRWNAAAMGPRRNIVGEWQAAARKHGLRFGVSEHMGASYGWFATAHDYDRFWPKLGVDYDGADPANQDLYHTGLEPFKGGDTWYAKSPAWHQAWFDRVTDLLDQHRPDLLYSDGGLPFGVVGRSMLAGFYNADIAAHAGRLEAVYTCKDMGTGEFYGEAAVEDVERGVLKGINPLPWQTDTSIGNWFYSEGYRYKSTAEVVHMLADIVSKNGNLLLNVVLYADGSLPPESQTFLDEMAAWMGVNGEAIHGTRPWKLYGEGPTETADGAFKEDAAYVAQDVRFTTKGDALYAVTLGEPKGEVAIAALGRRAGRVKSVTLLGAAALGFRQTEAALIITVPDSLPTRHASAFKVMLA